MSCAHMPGGCVGHEMKDERPVRCCDKPAVADVDPGRLPLCDVHMATYQRPEIAHLFPVRRYPYQGAL